jgi:predicted amidohydrolase YtcJ
MTRIPFTDLPLRDRPGPCVTGIAHVTGYDMDWHVSVIWRERRHYRARLIVSAGLVPVTFSDCPNSWWQIIAAAIRREMQWTVEARLSRVAMPFRKGVAA